ncbi:hypothetical protein [Fodinicola feengrottensis]|uniref:DUF2273 domain-containing protein n=1 Tax=Fodinicola feengrottensis TaxID=435914 RepID=A0ABN2I111_9ACTN|nr:hypothetical protein [Fodinicola feengrottensis]
MSRSTIGLFAGLLIAVATTTGGFFGFLAAVVFGIVGLGVGKVLAGELDIASYLGGQDRQRR